MLPSDARRILLLVLGAISTSAPVGTLRSYPLLSPLGLVSKRGCRTTGNTTAALRQLGIVRMTILEASREPLRSVAVSTDREKRILSTSAFYSLQAGQKRRVGENIMVFYSADGRMQSGQRNYTTTGTPASTGEDRSAPITQAEADSAMALARSVMRMCAP